MMMTHASVQETHTSSQKKYYNTEEISKLQPGSIPIHVAIIPDGNRRWAKKAHTARDIGHREGANTLIEIVKAAKEIGIKVITFYLFSTENWSRPQDEVQALMWLLQQFLIEQRPEMLAHGIKVNTIGEVSLLPNYVQEAIRDTKEITNQCNKIDMVMALNYGSRDEICRAVRSIVQDCENKKIYKEEISETLLSKYLDTARWSDPELLIRTSGELRISNYLLWQISYAEVYVTDVLWPDFTPHHLLDAVINYQKRERRLGGA